MNAFEYIVSELLHEQGYWTRVSYRLNNLTRKDKLAIGKPSLPRPELDIVGYNARRNEVLIVECKSFMDSAGVRVTSFDGTSESEAKVFKLFTEEIYQEVVKERLVEQLKKSELIPNRKPSVQLAVAAGKIRKGDADQLAALFEERGWWLIEPEEIAAWIRLRADKGYEDEIMTVVSKLLTRNPPES